MRSNITLAAQLPTGRSAIDPHGTRSCNAVGNVFDSAVAPPGPLMSSREAVVPTTVLSVLQFAPVPGDMQGNAVRIADALSRARCDVAVTPELCLTGYDVGDRVHSLAQSVQVGAAVGGLSLPVAGTDVLLGLIEAGAGGPYNSAVALRDGAVVFRHRKLYLPTYGMFDEGRWFGRGRTLETWTCHGGWTAGVLICEDLWHPGLVYVLASRGIDVLFVQAAAPGRDVWDGGARGGFASADVWERIIRTTAQLYGIYVALANRVGIEGGVSFAGGSLIAAPDGSVLARADHASEDTLTVELSRAELDRARRPYDHGRDDDAALVLRELRRTVQPA
ncbi:carbon-nitrogen hydrolase [soil metagenome]